MKPLGIIRTLPNCRFSRLPLALRLIVLALLITIGCVSFHFDHQVATLLAVKKTHFCSALALLLNHVGDWPCLAGLGFVVFLAALASRNQWLVRVLFAMLLASIVAGVMVNGVRAFSGRSRPSTKVEDQFYGIVKDGKWLVTNNQYNSFPSAHTATAIAFMGVLLFASWRFGLAAIGFALAVAWARIYSGSHHFSDVTVSIVMGLITARWSWLLVRGNPVIVSRLLDWRDRAFDSLSRTGLATFRRNLPVAPAE
ncbi:MAG: phosphatase PAP2 family protein [Chthoniobacteraceae bacterium]